MLQSIEVRQGVKLLVCECTAIEHAGRWNCNICGEKASTNESMYTIALPVVGDEKTKHIFMDICDRCRTKLAMALNNVVNK
jgi:hypothetical protein